MDIEQEEYDDDMGDMAFMPLFEDPNRSEPDGREVMEHLNKVEDAVSTLYKCESENAKSLFIFDIAYKMQCNDQYDIGGIYIDGHAELWFHYTTSSCPGDNYLVSLFVHHKNPGMFSLGISSSNTLKRYKGKVKTVDGDMVWLKFNSTHPDTMHYIKTFCFSEKDRQSLQGNTLHVPISVNMKCTSMIEESVLQNIKSEHDFGEKLLKGKERDFVLKSSSGKEYKVHKIVLAAHSTVLRDAIRSEGCNSYCIDLNDNELELLLDYLYTGTVKSIQNQDHEALLEISDKYILKNLCELAKNAIKVSITTSNALYLAILADKYNYEDIQHEVFQFVKFHPEVLESDAFSKIDNANVVKKLLKFIHYSSSKQN